MGEQVQIQMTAFKTALTILEGTLSLIDEEGNSNPSYPEQRALTSLFIMAANQHLFVIRESCPAECLTEAEFKAAVLRLMQAIFALTEGAVKAFRHAVHDHAQFLTNNLITLTSSLPKIMQGIASGGVADTERTLAMFSEM